MAHFDKFANLSPVGWDKKSATQTLKVGQSAHIGLWGGGPGGEDLEVVGGDDGICVPHEEPRPRAAQYPNWRHFLVTGLKAGTVNLKAYVPGTSNAYASMRIVVTGSSRVKLVYFPGERDEGTTVMGRIYVIGGNGESIAAAGGPRAKFKNEKDAGHTGEPTPAGIYKLGPRQHVVTGSWLKSCVPWGATLRINAQGEVEYQDDSGKGGWKLVSGPNGVLTKAYIYMKQHNHERVTQREAEIFVHKGLVDTVTKKLNFTVWEMNDFGRWGWNLRRNGKHTGYYIHTTPPNEKQAKADPKHAVATLENSHGCIHIDPFDRDDFWNKHYLAEGTEFEVRPYTESGPP